MLDGLKNMANNAIQQVAKQVIAPPKESSFLEKGLLTPEEFVQSGDKLIWMCESWKWYQAVDPKYQSQYLPKEKQFLGIENIRSRMRVKDLLNENVTQIKEGEDGVDLIISAQTEEKQQLDQEEVKKVEQSEDLRIYKLYIIYDHYYFTPRLYLSGTDKNGPLTYDQIKEDIMSEYADKTVTNEYHPHLNIYLPTVHPCKHADTLKFLTQQMLEGGGDQKSIHADNSIQIFLKFMGSVIPTIEFDFVAEIFLG